MEQTNSNVLYWSLLAHGEWEMILAATSEGLCFVGSINQPLDELKKWSESKLPHYELRKDDTELLPYINEFKEYFKGKLKHFTIPVDLRGTAFQCSVWNILRDLPYGTTHSYSEIANIAENSKAVRAVAAAIGANPLLIMIPCHRVIGKNGALTGYRGGLAMKEKLLELEKKNIGA